MGKPASWSKDTELMNFSRLSVSYAQHRKVARQEAVFSGNNKQLKLIYSCIGNFVISNVNDAIKGRNYISLKLKKLSPKKWVSFTGSLRQKAWPLNTLRNK